MCKNRMQPVALVALALATACGGDDTARTAQTPATAEATARISSCALLTQEEVQAATGWASLTIDSTSVGGTCNFRGPNEFNDFVSVTVARGLPAMSSSAELAQFRSSKIGPDDAIKPVFTPEDGFGVPAVRNQLPGAKMAAIEAAKNGALLLVSANTYDIAKALMPTALSRLP